MSIKINNINFGYKSGFQLDISELEINSGEIVGLVGNNGAGKTTLLKLMLDLLELKKGNIVLNGIEVKKNGEWKNDTGAFIDTSYLIPFYTPEEYFNFIGTLHGISNEEIANKLMSYEHFFNGEILNQNKKLIRNFSKGNKIKIAVVGALLFEPKILILDEPIEGLDPTSRAVLKNILIDYNKNHQGVILISSHDINYVAEICSRIVILEKGKILKDIANTEDKLSEMQSYFFKD